MIRNKKYETQLDWRWWKASDYIVKEGFISPTTANVSEYNPWDEFDFDAVKRTNDAFAPPHITLANMGELLNYDNDENDTGRILKPVVQKNGSKVIMRKAEELVCDWCSTNGLLGILPHRTIQVTLPLERFNFQYEQTKYVQSAGNWGVVVELSQSISEAEFSKGVDAIRSKLRLGEHGESPENPSAILKDLFGESMIQSCSLEPLHISWTKHILPKESEDDCSFPVPDSDDFHIRYRENLTEFVETAKNINSLMSEIASSQNSNKPFVGNAFLSKILAGTAPSFGVYNSKPAENWESVSLLGVIGLMIRYDILHPNVHILRCQAPGCHNFFRSNRADIKYCSLKCNGRVSQQNLRSKQQTGRKRA